uniref:Uncharacterized protein n=1 Tax=Vespula pensylvanica TaxID=30213 RepID=A0A834PG72_VESPE|nr:hypothetical protein H0235_001682 [Vespula pensylvanica]
MKLKSEDEEKEEEKEEKKMEEEAMEEEEEKKEEKEEEKEEEEEEEEEEEMEESLSFLDNLQHVGYVVRVNIRRHDAFVPNEWRRKLMARSSTTILNVPEKGEEALKKLWIYE